jgi:hypothetical protein
MKPDRLLRLLSISAELCVPRDLLRDDQSSSVLSARNVFAGHPDPRESQDDCWAEMPAV